MLDGNPVAMANGLVAQAWAAHPALFEGQTGPKPHKASVAAFALAAGVLLEAHRGNEILQNAYTLALGIVMEELAKNAHVYPFHHVDGGLLARAANVLSKEVEALEQSPILSALGL